MCSPQSARWNAIGPTARWDSIGNPDRTHPSLHGITVNYCRLLGATRGWIHPRRSLICLLCIRRGEGRKEDAIPYHTMPYLRTLTASVVVVGQRASGPSFQWHRKRDVSEVRTADTRAGSCLFEEMRCARKQTSGCPMHSSLDAAHWTAARRLPLMAARLNPEQEF